MKRIVAVLIAALLLLQCLPLASASDGSQGIATERVSALEFCELYTKRLMEFNSEYGQNTGGLDTRVNSIFAVYDRGDTYGASCSGGALTLNKTDLTIESLTGTIMDLDAEDQEGHNVILNALITISALEMDDLEAKALELRYAIDPSQPENVFMKYLQEYDNIIHPALSSNADILDAGEEVLIYQGNYDYYAVYKKDDPVLENSIYLFAKARE